MITLKYYEKINLFFNLYHQFEWYEFYISHTEAAVTLFLLMCFLVFHTVLPSFKLKKNKNPGVKKTENCTIPVNATSNFLYKEI